MGKSYSNWSSPRFFKRLLCVSFACTILFSPAWMLHADASIFATPGVDTVDPSWETGSYACLALDSKGNPGISYYDFNNTHLKYAYWNGSRWFIQTVDSNGFNGLHTSVAFDSQDLPHISYSAFNGTYYAYWNGSNWNIEAVDSYGSFTSIAIDADDNPHISYFGISGADLKYAVWNSSGWSIQTVDSEGIVGEFTSLKLDSSGYAYISYLDVTKQDLKIAWQDITGWHIQVVDSAGNVGWYSSLALDSKGNRHIGYFDNASRDLKYACSNGTEWTIQTIDCNGDVGTDTSLALDSNDYPRITYTDNTNHVLKYAVWNGSNWIIKAFPVAGYVGEYTSLPNDQTSLQIDQNDTAHVAYCDWGSYCLKYIASLDTLGFYTINHPTVTLNVTPNPVAVGQTVTISILIDPLPQIPNSFFSGVIINVTNPDGTSCYLGPFMSNSNGTVLTAFAPTQVGNMTFQASLARQEYPIINTIYSPSQSNIVTLQVQQNATTTLPSPSPTPSPTTVQQNSQSTSSQSTQSSSNYWQDDQQYNSWYGDSEDSGYQQNPQPNYYLPSYFPVVETGVAGVVSFLVCVGVILILKRWE
ncbi:MAG: hypothetical protein ACQCN4_01875 [Candidatus Bathyarchaeia archaeon]